MHHYNLAAMLATATMLLAGMVSVTTEPVAAEGPMAPAPATPPFHAIVVLDSAAMLADLDATGTARIDVGFPLELVLRETELFHPGQKRVIFLDDHGNVIGEEALELRTFRGVVAGDPASTVVMAFDAIGVIGTIETRDTRYHLSPVEPDDGKAAGESVLSWRPHATASLPGVTATGWADENSIYLHADAPMVVTQIGTVQPYADKTYRNAHSNYATRITNAFNHQTSMWTSYTNINVLLNAVIAPANDYSTSKVCSTHLNAFGAARAAIAGVDAYQLFTGVNLDDCYGIAKVRYLCADMAGKTPTMATALNSLIEAIDHSWIDWYDPDESDDLGLVSGQEIAHNWGEPCHPQDKNAAGKYNIMATGTDHDKRAFWFTSGASDKSADRVKTATAGRL